MQQLFSAYLPNDPDYFKRLWKNAQIVLDANVLLDLYRYSPQTRDEMVGVLRKLSDRMWFPHQVAFEFVQNRPVVIEEQHRLFEVALATLQGIKVTIAEEFKKHLNFKYHPALDKNSLLSSVNQIMDHECKAIAARRDDHPNYFDHDSVLDSILELSEGRTGDPIDESELTNLKKVADARFEKRIPPGYKDQSKNNDKQYGDFFIWIQMKTRATKENRSIIFVTNDVKEDWYWRVSGKTLGCRPELIQEFRGETSQDFHVYPSDQFLRFAKDFLQEQVKQQALEEIQSVRRKHEDMKMKHRRLMNFLDSYSSVQSEPTLQSIVEKHLKKMDELAKKSTGPIPPPPLATLYLDALDKLKRQQDDRTYRSGSQDGKNT